MLTSYERAEQIFSRQDLALFLSELHQDLRQNPDLWENADLERFLEALAAWVAATPTDSRLAPETPQWRTFAEMMLAARIYE